MEYWLPRLDSKHIPMPENVQPETSSPDGISSARLRFEMAMTAACTASLAAGFFGEWLGLIGPLTAKILYMTAYAAGGYAGLRESLNALRKGDLNVDLLMILAAAGAAVIGEWLEGAVLLFLFSLSNTLQYYAMGRSRRAIRALMKLRPDRALKVFGDGSEEEVAVEELRPDDLIRVKPGERIPIDGVVEKGESSVNQSAITGESMPVSKEEGDEVFAATLNGGGVLAVRVTRHADETTLAKILRMVEEAQGRKAETQRYLDDFESPYALGVILVTLGLILVPWLLLEEPFDPAFYRAMTVLVVASPCALIISTPASILSAIAIAARNGVLFKGGAFLEQAASIEMVAFDKTGTLTTGEPKVTDVLVAEPSPAGEDDGERTQIVTEEQVLALAASAEEHSEHHLAAAILDKARREGVTWTRAAEVQAEAGKGIAGRVGGRRVRVGNHKMFPDVMDRLPGALRERLEVLRKEGKTYVFVESDGVLMGLIALADTLREEAPEALESLRELGIGELVMLTGDLPSVAEAIADRLGLDRVYAELLPDRKVELVRKLAGGRPVAMVGDGVNDAPALASSNIGIAMGAAGTDAALETADVVLMSDDLMKIPYLVKLSRKARKVVWQNIAFSLAVIALLVASVFLFSLPLPLGVVGHEGSTLLVVLNGLRLLAYSP